MNHLGIVAREARPSGSSWNRHVGDYLVGRLTDDGLHVDEQNVNHRGTALRNIVAIRPGSHSTGAVMLCAHYDSVPQSPGAVDDGIGMAILLEVARSLAKRPPPRNNTVIVFTDGEEDGLYGAYTFATQHDAFDDVKVVVNVDCIGGAGLPIVYETGDDNGLLIRLLDRAGGSYGGAPSQSVVSAIYEQSGLWTDFRVFRNGGRTGLNVSLAGQAGAFHHPIDTVDRINQDSVGALGKVVGDLAIALGSADLRNLAEANRVYFTLPGSFFVHYPVYWNAILTGAIGVALGFTYLRAGRLQLQTLFRHVIYMCVIAIASLVVVGIAWLIVQTLVYLSGEPWALTEPILRSPLAVRLELLGIAMITLAVAWLIPWDRDDDPMSDTPPLLMPWAILLLASLVWTPAASYLLVWPVIIVVIAEWVRGKGNSSSRVLMAALLSMLPLLLVVPAVELMYQLTQAWVTIAVCGATLSFVACWSIQWRLWHLLNASRPRTASCIGIAGMLLMTVAAFQTL